MTAAVQMHENEAGPQVRGVDEIRKVLTTAGKIGLMAMNAIFLAKRAGQSALGFGVLSNELRRFALDLQKQMNLLREMTLNAGAAGARRQLVLAIADTTQLVELGSVLARSAKIEAAYGGPFSAALMQVSSDFERTIGEIRRSLESLADEAARD